MVGGGLDLGGDEEIGLDAACRGGAGLVGVAGTGSKVVGRGSSGEMVSAGGWGPVIGDEGSGTWIGLEAIRAGDPRAAADAAERLLDTWHPVAERVRLARRNA